MAFYKLDPDSNELTSGTYIMGSDEYGNGYDLNELDHIAGLYTYPYNGWYWFETLEEAETFFNLGYV